MEIIKPIALRACNDYRKTIRNGPVENRRPLTLLLFPSNTDLPRSTFPRRWLWKWRLSRKPRLEQCAPNVESYNLHTLPPYPKNLSPTPSWGPNAIEWSVSRQAAGSIGFVPDTTIFLLFPSPPPPPLPVASLCLFHSIPPSPLVADLFLLRFVFCNPFALVHASPGYTLICNCFFPVQYSIILLRFIYFEFIYFFFFKFTLDRIYVNFFPFFFRFVQTNSDTIYGYHKRSFWIDDNVGWKVYFHESPWIFNGTQLQSVKRRYE